MNMQEFPAYASKDELMTMNAKIQDVMLDQLIPTAHVLVPITLPAILTCLSIAHEQRVELSPPLRETFKASLTTTNTSKYA